ncbi:ATP-binding Cassette (ABC) Superfamily, partial [Thraustotheca clavata]
DFFSVVTLLSRVSTPVTVLGGFMRVAIGNAASLQRLDTILDQRYVRESDTDSLPRLPPMTSFIRFHKVAFQYPSSDSPVVMDFTANGHYVCIVGPSGCGKSSLLNAIMQVYPLAQGAILWDSSPINNFSQASFLERIAVVFQDGGILNGTIFDNIRYGCPTATLDDCKEAAQLANCHTFISQLPMQYDTIVGQHADMALSGGQMQRICLARALVRKPQVLLLDEATSALDTETEGKVVETLRQLTKKWAMTIISVTHRLATTQSADNILVMHNGTLAEEGTYSTLMAQPFGIFHEMVQKKLDSNSPRSSVPKSDEEVMLLSEVALGAFTRGLESRVSSRRSSQRPSMDSLGSFRKNPSVLETKGEESRDSYIVIKAVMDVDISLNATENVVEKDIEVEMCKIPRTVRSSHFLGHELSSAALSSVQSGVSKIQSIFKDKQVQQQQQLAKAIVENEEVQKLRLQAIWQLFVTGFEVIKYPKSGRARKRVIWLTLDGKLCVGRSKTDRHAGKFMLLGDIEKVEKGCSAPQFSNSLSWREARGKEQMCLSIAARSKNLLETLRLFAIQVSTNNVRNIIVNNWTVLLNLLHGDADGVFPKTVRVRLARHFAATGEIMALAEVRNALSNEGVDSALSPVKDGDQNSEDSASDEEIVMDTKRRSSIAATVQPVVNALSLVKMKSAAVIQGVFGSKSSTAAQIVMPKEDKAVKLENDLLMRHLQAIWQLFIQGFEIIKYPNKGRARRRILWLTLDGRLCVGRAKADKHASKFMQLWDIERFVKGCTASQFSNSISWRDAKSKENSCFSIESKSRSGHVQTFALQVVSANVRNLLCDNGTNLLNCLHGDNKGVYPKIARMKIAKHYAFTGEILSLQEVRAIMTREGSEMVYIPRVEVRMKLQPASDEWFLALASLLAPDSLSVNENELETSPKEQREAAALAASKTLPGDIIVVTTNGFSYSSLRHMCDQPHDHALIVVNETQALHVGPPKAILIPLERVLLPKRQPAIFRVPSIAESPQAQALITKYATQFVGTPYNLSRVIQLITSLATHKSFNIMPFKKLSTPQDAWICTDAILALLAAASPTFQAQLKQAASRLELSKLGSATLRDILTLRQLGITERVCLPPTNFTVEPSPSINWSTIAKSATEQWNELPDMETLQMYMDLGVSYVAHSLAKQKPREFERQLRTIGYIVGLLVVLNRHEFFTMLFRRYVQAMLLKHVATQLIRSKL